MRRPVLLMVSVVLGVLIGSGVAMAATVNCAPLALTCRGTNANDTINGSYTWDDIYSLGGNDIVRGNGAGDYIEDGFGDDTVYGGPGGDTFGLYDQNPGNDRYYGGGDNDTAWSRKGRDVLFMGAGNDWSDVQDFRGGPTDRVNCGPGRDQVYFNTGRRSAARDFIASNCERRYGD